MNTNIDPEIIHTHVKRIFRVDDLTLGSAQQEYLLRYRGHLLGENSDQSYQQLAESLKPFDLMPLFREENGVQVIFIRSALPAPRPGSPRLNLLFFILTVISVLVSGALSNLQSLPENPIDAMLLILQTGWPFTVSLLAILATHEFGHYFAGRAHGVKVSLPFFIPLPFTSFGTLGAFISMKEAPRNRKVLMDIAVAGPIAGFIVSLVVIWIGLSLSKVETLPAALAPGQALQIEGNSLTYLLMKYLHFGKLLPQPASFEGLSPALYWLRYFFTGRPFPLGGADVMIHPVAWAGWAGLLVTALNLIPAGQLDGGHVFSLLFGTKGARKLFPVILVVLVGMGFLWSGWWLWAALVFLFGRVYAEPLDQITPLDPARKVLGILALIIFLLAFTPVPITLMG